MGRIPRGSLAVIRPRNGLIAGVLMILGAGAPVDAQTSTRSASGATPTDPVASNRSLDRATGNTTSAPLIVKASLKVEGTVSPGLRVKLDGSGSSGGRMWYRWLQTEGSKVTIENPTNSEASFIVPQTSSELGFALVVGNASGVDALAIRIEVEDPERDALDQSLKADAGDDQTVRVGRKVVLNGVRSEPRGRIRYRWVQAGGPRVDLRSTDGPMATFVPESPGRYLFALIVGTAGGSLSEASLVKVEVEGRSRIVADDPSIGIDELARASLASIDGGTRYAEDLSKAFDAVADGIGSFRSFGDAIAETTRRLDSVVPRDKERRAIWIEQLFSPLMIRIVAGMREDGVDLTQPGAQTRTLTRDQKSRLAGQLRYAAVGLRATRVSR